MILRKPYAFLIKHFRLIHLLLAIFTCYSIYQTKNVLDFFNDYIITLVNVIGQNLSSVLIPSFYSFAPILIILMTLIILVLLAMKKKPNLFYFVNIIIYIFVAIVISVASSTLDKMSINLIDVRTIRLVRDFVTISFALQFISVPIIIIRTVGFDIKKFNFKEDLRDLDISEEDREEFEVQVNIDKNKLHRNFRKTIRQTKYIYKENLLFCNLILGGSIFSIVFVILFSLYFKTPTLKYNTYFSGNGFTMSILDSYLVNTDYKGNVIDEEYYFLALKIKVRYNGNMSAILDTATTKIVIGNYYYVPLREYKEKFFDLGNIYQNEKIGNEYVEKVLLYQIPKQLINEEMIFSFVNKNSFTDKEGFKSTNVTIKNTDLTGIKSIKKTTLGQTLYMEESIFSNLNLSITNYEINNKFKLKYNHCISSECFESYEYLTPSLNTNYDKTLLKISGNLNKNMDINEIYDLYDLIEKFGKIVYEIDGMSKRKDIKLNEVVSSKIKQNNIYYVEVPLEIKDATHISIMFTIRDRIYEYVLK